MGSAVGNLAGGITGAIHARKRSTTGTFEAFKQSLTMQQLQFEQMQRMWGDATGQQFDAFKKYSPQEARILTENRRASQMANPVFVEAESRILGDLNDSERGERLSAALAERLGQAQSAAGTFGSMTAARDTSIARVGLEEQVRQQSLVNAMNFAAGTPGIAQGGLTGSMQSINFGQLIGGTAQGFDAGQNAFAWTENAKVQKGLQHAYFVGQGFAGAGDLFSPTPSAGG